MFKWFNCVLLLAVSRCKHCAYCVHLYCVVTGDQELQTPDQQHACQGPQTDSQNTQWAGSHTHDQDHQTDSQTEHQSCSQTADQEFHTVSPDNSKQDQHEVDPQSSKYDPQASSTCDSHEQTGPVPSSTCSNEKEHPHAKDGSMKSTSDRSEPVADVAQEESGQLPRSSERDDKQQQLGTEHSNKPTVSQEIQVNACLSSNMKTLTCVSTHNLSCLGTF